MAKAQAGELKKQKQIRLAAHSICHFEDLFL